MMALPYLPEEQDDWRDTHRPRTHQPSPVHEEYVVSIYEVNPHEQRRQGLAFPTEQTQASGKSQIPFYLLVKLLHEEALLTSVQIRLVSEKKLRRIQRNNYKKLQTKLFSLWDECKAAPQGMFLFKQSSYVSN